MRTQSSLIVLLLLFPFGASVYGQMDTGGGTGDKPARTTWEYRELYRSDVEALAPKEEKGAFVAGLNKLGAEGWELVAVESASGGHVERYLFKRAKVQGGPAKEGKDPKGAEGVPSTQVLRLKNAKAADLVKTLTTLFRAVPGLQLTADERTNSLLITGSSEQMGAVQKLVAELDSIESGEASPKKK